MESILTELKSSKHDGESSREEAFVIREAATRTTSTQETEHNQRLGSSIDTDVLNILRNHPDVDSFLQVLRAINQQDASLDLHLPGSLQAQIIHQIVSTSLPVFWHILEVKDRNLLARCLTSVAGINAVLAGIRSLLPEIKRAPQTKQHEIRMAELLQLLDIILQPEDMIRSLWIGLNPIENDKTKHSLAWKEVINILASGKLLALVIEAADSIQNSESKRSISRRDGSSYTIWLARNIVKLVQQDRDTTAPTVTAASQLITKALSLGYSELFVSTILTDCLRNGRLDILTQCIALLTSTTKRRFLEAALSWLSSIFTTAITIDHKAVGVAEVAALLQVLMKADSAVKQLLATIATDATQSASISYTVRRAIILVLNIESPETISAHLQQAILIFGDNLFITHSPVAQQESLTQSMLLMAAYLHRQRPNSLKLALQAGKHMQAVSNRLSSSSLRARWLGMIFGTAMSRLIDTHGSSLNFGTTEMETEEAQSWLASISISDEVGSINDLLAVIDNGSKTRASAKAVVRRRAKQDLPIINGKQTYGPPRPPQMLNTIPISERVTELEDDYEDPDADLKPYAKPDSDPEDSDEDATLVNRNKVRPPVYIRTLMAMLRDNEKADRFDKALKHAAALIRRKTGHGREVTDHAEELARILANLQDNFDTEDFDELRLQALIAVTLSCPDEIAPWLARQAFARDYSTAQRCFMLTVLGLSGRELAGFKHEDQVNRTFDNAIFPSKQLPARMHAIYGQEGISTRLLSAAAKSVEQSLVQPMALAAADQTTKHLDAVKVRKFSSRMDVERMKKKPVANELAKIFREAFFNPLHGTFQQHCSAFGDASQFMSTPVVLTTFLKTIAILLHAAGPAIADLGQITTEFWELLLYLRIKAHGDATVMEALLFCLLTLLEANVDKQDLVTSHAKALMETKEWAEMVFERTGGGNLIEGEGEEARVRMLCAGVLTKTNEVITAYQKVLLGSWSGS